MVLDVRRNRSTATRTRTVGPDATLSTGMGAVSTYPRGLPGAGGPRHQVSWRCYKGRPAAKPAAQPAVKAAPPKPSAEPPKEAPKPPEPAKEAGAGQAPSK